jgi:hypothetical protein
MATYSERERQSYFYCHDRYNLLTNSRCLRVDFVVINEKGKIKQGQRQAVRQTGCANAKLSVPNIYKSKWEISLVMQYMFEIKFS